MSECGWLMAGQPAASAAAARRHGDGPPSPASIGAASAAAFAVAAAVAIAAPQPFGCRRHRATSVGSGDSGHTRHRRPTCPTVRRQTLPVYPSPQARGSIAEGRWAIKPPPSPRPAHSRRQAAALPDPRPRSHGPLRLVSCRSTVVGRVLAFSLFRRLLPDAGQRGAAAIATASPLVFVHPADRRASALPASRLQFAVATERGASAHPAERLPFAVNTDSIRRSSPRPAKPRCQAAALLLPRP